METSNLVRALAWIETVAKGLVVSLCAVAVATRLMPEPVDPSVLVANQRIALAVLTAAAALYVAARRPRFGAGRGVPPAEGG
jgi:hypothetical protein